MDAHLSLPVPQVPKKVKEDSEFSDQSDPASASASSYDDHEDHTDTTFSDTESVITNPYLDHDQLIDVSALGVEPCGLLTESRRMVAAIVLERTSLSPLAMWASWKTSERSRIRIRIRLHLSVEEE